MNETEALKLLMRVKALWPRLPDDPLVQAEWWDAFRVIEYRDANVAVTEMRELGESEPPVIGQLRRAALHVADRREAHERASRRELEDQSRDPELVSVKEMVDAFLKRQGTTRDAIAERAGWKK